MNVFQIPGARFAVAAAATPNPTAAGKIPRTAHAGFYILDLPGYGYARVSKTERAGFRRLLAEVLERSRLVGAVWLLDIRHDPSQDDRDMHELLGSDDVPVLAALTKADKLPRGQRLKRANALQETLHLDDDQVVITSAETGDGIRELRDAIAGLAAA